MSHALITGITGQDGAYLAQFLIGRGYTVHGTYRPASSENFWRLAELGLDRSDALRLAELDLADLGSCVRLLGASGAREIYNLAAQSFVSVSFEQPVATASANAIGALNLLEAIRIVDPAIRYYQASSSEMYGKVQASPQDEATPFYPRSPYAVAKLFAHWMTVNYRESYGIFGVSGILFNHESPLRGRGFVTRKITHGMAQLRLGKLECLELGNLDARRDWGYAPEYVAGMWQMVQAPRPDNYVLATGRTETVRQFVGLAAAAAGFDLEWRGSGTGETGVERSSGRTLVRINPAFFRPAEVDAVVGNPAKAKRDLGWSAATPLEHICQTMVEADIRRAERGQPF